MVCWKGMNLWRFLSDSISKSIVSLLPSPCRATALSAARRLDTFDLEKE
jgi:hypothetical protein